MPHIKLKNTDLEVLRTVDERLMSYNVEMTEVTGGTFWKAYTPEQIEGTEEFPPIKGLHELGNLMQWYDPIESTNPRLIKLAKEFGPVWVRVSGTWATKTYYDFDGTGVTPEGYQSRMTRQQWVNLINFVDSVGGKLLISVANCEGLHHAEEPWNPSEAEKIFSLSRELGHPIDAVEFTNEPNMFVVTGFPAGYTVDHFRRDQDLFHKWVRENYPDTIVVGPCTVDTISMGSDTSMSTAGIGAAFGTTASTDDLMEGCTEKLDVFSYHYYNGISERLAAVMPTAHWSPEQATSENYLAMAGFAARGAAPLRDKFVPGGQMWVTESGDAGGGGDTWASTYLDVFRTLNELGEFCTITDGIIFHNTLASSDYGFLDHHNYMPRPNYFAVLLWTRLMGQTVYNSGTALQEGAHVYCHSRKDGEEGCVYLVINNSRTETTTAELPKDAVRYTLAGRDGIRSRVMTLNGKDLILGENDELPCLCGEAVSAGTIEFAPATCTFIVL
ncbi:MAG: beta-glucuronidase [Oscillospiraceae bacterium]|nr:beta-glucuronidase [Oscillospiraceae bacterium]